MAPAAVLTGKWATAEDTARELGVPQSQLKKLKQLAALALSRPAKSKAPRNGAQPTATRNTGIVARNHKTAKTRSTKSARTATKKVGAATRAKS